MKQKLEKNEKETERLLKMTEKNPDEAQTLLDEIIGDIKFKEASDLNNEGMKNQIAYAVAMGYGETVKGALKNG